MEKPLVSIIIRTCGRPMLLKKALESVEKQEYPYIETIVVEDGENVSEQMIRDNFPGLKCLYFYTKKKVGRCVTGNIGLEHAHGKYVNFLDDDDIFLTNHVTVLVDSLMKGKEKAAYSIAEEQQIVKRDVKQGTFKVKRKFVRYRQPFNRLLLCYLNYIPIQSIMFEKELYEEHGGFDEKLNLLEDWDLWVRYALETDYLFIPVITSVYYTPYKGTKTRGKDLQQAENVVKQKYVSYFPKLNVEKINKEMEYILNTYQKKGIYVYMKKLRDFILYRDN